MTDHASALAEVHARLRYKRLNPLWAKLEVLLGLAAGGAGLLLGQWFLMQPEAERSWGLAAAALALFVLGGYLALAGHRSHLYQSSNNQTALLLEELRHSREQAGGLTQ
jgi:hypothetical protein